MLPDNEQKQLALPAVSVDNQALSVLCCNRLRLSPPTGHCVWVACHKWVFKGSELPLTLRRKYFEGADTLLASGDQLLLVWGSPR